MLKIGNMWKSIKINKQNIIKDNEKTILIKCYNNDYVFWYPIKLSNIVKGGIEIRFNENFKFELFKYGKGRFNKYCIVDKKIIDSENLFNIFESTNKNKDSYLIVKEPEKIEKEVYVLDEFKNY